MVDILIEGQKGEQVKKFKYLGAIICIVFQYSDNKQTVQNNGIGKLLNADFCSWNDANG